MRTAMTAGALALHDLMTGNTTYHSQVNGTLTAFQSNVTFPGSFPYV
jgi:hypothetical protein